MGRFPFPHNQRLPHCTYPRAAHHLDVVRAYQAWRDEIVTRDGARGFARPRRPDTPDGVANSTVSEGVAYGMLIAVMLDEQALFDDMWQYAQCFINRNGLMDWYIAPDGNGPLGVGAATDADQDMAWALVMASRQWGGCGAGKETYEDSAKRLIDSIFSYEVDHEQWPDMLIPGDDWRGRDVFNPSYFAPNEYRVFGELTGNVSGWNRVVDEGYRVLGRSLNAYNGNENNGLVPAWCTSQGQPVEAFPGAMTNFQYDSARTPFRMAADYAATQEPRARDYLRRVVGFFAAQGAHRIVDGYALDGQPRPDPAAKSPNPGSAVFIGTAASGAMHDVSFQPFLDEAYARVRTGELLARSRYYNHCWTVLSLLMLTGNFVTFEP